MIALMFGLDLRLVSFKLGVGFVLDWFELVSFMVVCYFDLCCLGFGLHCF